MFGSVIAARRQPVTSSCRSRGGTQIGRGPTLQCPRVPLRFLGWYDPGGPEGWAGSPLPRSTAYQEPAPQTIANTPGRGGMAPTCRVPEVGIVPPPYGERSTATI